MNTKKTTISPGIHLYRDERVVNSKMTGMFSHYEQYWYWNITSKNGREIARSSETYTRKANAVKSIKMAAEIFRYKHANMYFDHSTDSKLKCYL